MRYEKALKFVSGEQPSAKYVLWVKNYDRVVFQSPDWPTSISPESFPVPARYETADAPKPGEPLPPPPRRGEQISPQNPALPRKVAQFYTRESNGKIWRIGVMGNPYVTFVLGADIGDFEQTRATPEQGIAYEVAVDEACNAIAGLGCPVVAAIEGYCYGGACNLAMASDFRFIAANAKFSIPAAKLSIVYSARGMARLVALVGLTEAKRIFFTAQPFLADHALKSGFADAIEADPVAAAHAWLAGIAGLAPLSIAGSKAILNMVAMPEQPYDAALAHDVTWRALTSQDYAEGRAAFAAKRPPQFRGE